MQEALFTQQISDAFWNKGDEWMSRIITWILAAIFGIMAVIVILMVVSEFMSTNKLIIGAVGVIGALVTVTARFVLLEAKVDLIDSRLHTVEEDLSTVDQRVARLEGTLNGLSTLGSMAEKIQRFFDGLIRNYVTEANHASYVTNSESGFRLTDKGEEVLTEKIREAVQEVLQEEAVTSPFEVVDKVTTKLGSEYLLSKATQIQSTYGELVGIIYVYASSIA